MLNMRRSQLALRLWLCIISLHWCKPAAMRIILEQETSSTLPYHESSTFGLKYMQANIFDRKSRSVSSCKPGDYLEVSKLVLPFNEDKHVAAKSEGQEFYPIGQVKPLSTRIASPSIFQACFTISSRTKQQSGICLKLDPIELNLVRLKESKRIRAFYHFDLCELHPNLTGFDPSRKIIVVIPGYRTGAREEWQQEIANQWLKLEDVNVIQVHWPAGNNRLVYESAAANVPVLARQITILLYYLARMSGDSSVTISMRKRIHLVGHSLGAHVAGIVGQELGGQVDRITALDPAGPIFDVLSDAERLSRSDAKFVAVLHTNAGKMRYLRMGVALMATAATILFSVIGQKDPLDQPAQRITIPAEIRRLSQVRRTSDTENTAWFGFEQPLGHMDYYANGGSIQPECQDNLHICDHGRAIDLYIATLKREIATRHYYGPKSRVVSEKRHRLYAFHSREYQVFQNGGKVHSECANFFLAESYGDAASRLEAHKRCMVPIDLVSTSNDLRRELVKDYRIDLGKVGRRYYFETLDSPPYVSDQLLMKIHTEVTTADTPVWSDGCRLVSLVRPAGEGMAFAHVDHRPHQEQPIHQGDFHGHIIPIADTNDWTRKFLTPDLLRTMRRESKTQAELRERLLPYLPARLIIKLFHEDEQTGLIEWLDSSERSSKCSLTIKTVELRSLGVAGVCTNLTLWYLVGSDDESPTIVESQESLPGLAARAKQTRPISVYSQDFAKYFFLSSVGISQ